MERDDLEYVGFWPRVGAELVDQVLGACITMPVLIGYYGESYLFDEDAPFIWGPLDFLMSWVVPAVLTISFWVWKQATPGKMVIGAKIVDAESGRCPTPAQFIGRYFAYALSLIALGLGFFWVFFNPRRQGWHDIMARTVVVRPKRKEQPVVTFGTSTNTAPDPQTQEVAAP